MIDSYITTKDLTVYVKYYDLMMIVLRWLPLWHQKYIHHQSGVSLHIKAASKHTGQCKSTGGCYNELVVAYFGTGGGVKWR